MAHSGLIERQPSLSRREWKAESKKRIMHIWKIATSSTKPNRMTFIQLMMCRLVQAWFLPSLVIMLRPMSAQEVVGKTKTTIQKPRANIVKKRPNPTLMKCARVRHTLKQKQPATGPFESTPIPVRGHTMLLIVRTQSTAV